MVKGRGTGISRKNQNNDGINSFAPEILLIFLISISSITVVINK